MTWESLLEQRTHDRQAARNASTTGGDTEGRVRCDLTKICSLVNWLPLLCREQVPSANRNFGLSCGPLLGTAGRAGLEREDKVCDHDDWYSYDSYCCQTGGCPPLMVKTTAMSPINHTSQSPNRNGFAQHTTSQPNYTVSIST